MQRMYDNRMPYYYHRESRYDKDSCKKDDEIECVKTSAFPANYSVAMAYIPFQTCTEIYDECKALAEGTLFVSLNKPFLGRCCK